MEDLLKILRKCPLYRHFVSCVVLRWFFSSCSRSFHLKSLPCNLYKGHISLLIYFLVTHKWVAILLCFFLYHTKTLCREVIFFFVEPTCFHRANATIFHVFIKISKLFAIASLELFLLSIGWFLLYVAIHRLMLEGASTSTSVYVYNYFFCCWIQCY